MIVHFGIDLIRPEWEGATVCIGVFDGVHLGHQQVVRTAVEAAKRFEEPCILVTFDRHPAWIVAPDRVPLSLATLSQNLDCFAGLGVAITVVLPFHRETATTSAQEFLDTTLRAKLKASRLVVGHDFALGRGREGTGEWLSTHIETTVVPAFEKAGHRVSSTVIRQLVTSGDVASAAGFLGRPFTLRGIVVAGQKLGRTLGFPTVNLALSTAQCVPGDGVYGGLCSTSHGRFPAAIGIGCRPTVGGQRRTIEAFLLDYSDGDVYGEAVDLEFGTRIRDDQRFPSLEELAAAIGRDVMAVRQFVAGTRGTI